MNNKAGIPALLASPSPLSRRHFHELFLMACTDPVINSCPFQYQLYSAKTLKSHFSYRKLNYLKETLFRYNHITLCKKISYCITTALYLKEYPFTTISQFVSKSDILLSYFLSKKLKKIILSLSLSFF